MQQTRARVCTYIRIRSYVMYRCYPVSNAYVHTYIYTKYPDNLFSMMRIVYLYPSTSNRFMTTDISWCMNLLLGKKKRKEGWKGEDKGRNLWKISKSREVPFIPLRGKWWIRNEEGEGKTERVWIIERERREEVEIPRIWEYMCIEERSNIVIWFFFLRANMRNWRGEKNSRNESSRHAPLLDI